MAKNKPFTIRVDTREHEGNAWTFEAFALSDSSFDVISTKVDIGDYDIFELPEKTLCIERKKSYTEICNNISKKDSPRFMRELEKMSAYKYAYIICEFTIHDVLKGSKFTTLPPAYVLSVLTEIEAQLGIHVHFAGKEAELLAYRILRKIWFLENGTPRWLKKA